LIQKIHELARTGAAKPAAMQHACDTTPLPRHIHLQAIDPARNIARDYQIDATTDLFGHIIVTLHWGRIGTKGQGRTISFADAQHAVRFVRQTLMRRASAKRRIGVPYYVACT
jgi:predicted DNA-binding WGR domain protein